MEICFAATMDYLPYACVTAVSAIKNSGGRRIIVHFMYSEITGQKMPPAEKLATFDYARNTVAKYPGSSIKFYDISDKTHLLSGQNIGMWSKAISLTHYWYLLAPMTINSDKVIYLDTDMVVNCDLSGAFDFKMRDCLLGMAHQRPGIEELGDDCCNSGFIVMNLGRMWLENTLDSMLEFGRGQGKSKYCDQNLIYRYFTKKQPRRLALLDERYNMFPTSSGFGRSADIKVLHFTGTDRKPFWPSDKKPFHPDTSLGMDLWWHAARETSFYEKFLFDIINKN